MATSCKVHDTKDEKKTQKKTQQTYNEYIWGKIEIKIIYTDVK